MAFFRLEAKVFSRERRGRSVIAAAAYRTGTKLKDERLNNVYDYARRSKGVVNSTILAPEGAPAWVRDSGQLWNAVEKGEKRADAQLAREFILAVPPELSPQAQFQTAADWAQKELVASGMIAEISLHHTKTGKNPHVHILCTMRKLDGSAFSAKKPREWNDVKLLMNQRESWAKAVNAALEQAGRDERVDHRSLKNRGIDRIPQPKIGVKATAMKRKGILEDPEALRRVRQVQVENAVMPHIRAIERDGHVERQGRGRAWWERSALFVSRAIEAAREKFKGVFEKFLDSRRRSEQRDAPDIDIGR